MSTALLVLRIIPGLLLMGHGLQKLLPPGYSPPLLHAAGHRGSGAGFESLGIRPGVVLVDPGAEREIRDRDVISKAGWTPYAGRRVRGRVVATFLRGREVARDGRTHDRFDGEFLPGPGARGPS